MLYVMASILLLPLSNPAQLFQLSTLQLTLLAFCCLNTVIAYGAFAEAMEHWHASKVSAILAISPLITIVGIGFIVWINPDYLHTDDLNLMSISGAILLVLGIVATSLVPLWVVNTARAVSKSAENVR